MTLEHEAETWASGFGGLQGGTVYDGLTTASLTLNLNKLIAWHGGKLFVSAFDIQGLGPSTRLVGNLQLISNIEATPDLKLYDLWFEQELFDRALSVRLGQEGANDEMMLTKYGAFFLNSSFGYPGLLSADLPSNGPNYPMAAPFVRVRYTSDKISFTGALFTKIQRRPARETRSFVIEAGPPFASTITGSPSQNSPTRVRSQDFREPISSVPGTPPPSSCLWNMRPLATICCVGTRAARPFYGIIDQMLWQEPGAKDNGIGAFLMVMGTPTAICFSDLYVEGGLNWKGPIRGRSNDVLGLGVAYLHLDPGYQQFATNAYERRRRNPECEKQRNGHRGHLPLRGNTLVGAAAGHSNGDQSLRRIAEPRQRSVALQRASYRASDDREILTASRAVDHAADGTHSTNPQASRSRAVFWRDTDAVIEI